MTYKEIIAETMRELAKDPKVVFIGYNVGCGSKAGGTLEGIPDSQLIEMPLAENLMMSVAIGMAIEGYKPVVYFERMDFITNAMDSIVNHLDKLKILSRGEYDPQVMIRCVVGNTVNPLYTGLTHTQNLIEGMYGMVNFPVYAIPNKQCIRILYLGEFKTKMLVEFKDSYDE